MAAHHHGDILQIGVCNTHDFCISGFSSLESLNKRLDERHELKNIDLDTTHAALDMLADDDPLWTWEADYLAQLCSLITTTISPQRLVLGGRVLRTKDGDRRVHLLKKIRARFSELNKRFPQYWDDLNTYIVLSAWTRDHPDQSLWGAFELARLKVVEGKLGANEIRKVFGLSISESVEWAVASVRDGDIVENDNKLWEQGTLCELPADRRQKINLHQHLRDGLKALRARKPRVFDGVEGVGVSTIGVVDREKHQLVSVARKGWNTSSVSRQRGVLVDFNELFLRGDNGNPFFLRLQEHEIIVQNDAPARCLAEYAYGTHDFDRPQQQRGLLYLMVSEGVNGAFVIGRDLPPMLGHPEMGHYFPQLHEHDKQYIADDRFRETVSGCPIHGLCLEGLASDFRIRHEFGRDTKDLHEDHEAIDIVAFYLAQWAMSCALFFDPARIIFGGKAFYGDNWSTLINMIRVYFYTMNAGYVRHYDDKDAVERLIDRARFGSGVRVLSALVLASATVGRIVPISAGEILDFEEARRRKDKNSKSVNSCDE